MPADWTKTAVALPPEGTLVEFLLDERNCAMRGTYAVGRFESRWNNYAPTSVRVWRELATASAPARPFGAPASVHVLHTRRHVDGPGGFPGFAVGAA